jgi:predicted O-linked N-acetylglucosamine transferase (SPINDLY family)
LKKKEVSMSVGRNEPCPCGSGKKYKQCCGALTEAPASIDLQAQAAAQARAGQLPEAIASLRQFTALQPGHAIAWLDLGQLLQKQGELSEAEACFRKALALADNLVANANLALILQLQGRIDESIAHRRRCITLAPHISNLHTDLLLALQYSSATRASDLLAEHRRFAEFIETPLRAQWPRHANPRQPERRLRIGYVSADLREHAVAWFFEPVLRQHDRSRVELFCYSLAGADAVTARLRPLADHWLEATSIDSPTLAARVMADGIDILVDLNGNTAGGRPLLFARKPAPVQISWLGYASTTGLAAMDYRITDAWLDPPGAADAAHVERLLRLPAWAVFQPAPDSPPVTDLPALGSGGLQLACLNNPAKLGPQVFALWARILLALPQARLLLGNAGDSQTRSRLLEQFTGLGVNAERLEFMPRLPLADYLALHQRIDLALDPFPFTGGATTCHGLWMGVPVLTMAGDTTISRQGSAFMHGLGLPEFVVHNEDSYVSRALALAADLPHLQAVRQSLRARMAPEARTRDFTRSLEDAYAMVWQRWCAS